MDDGSARHLRPWFLDRFDHVMGSDDQWRTECPLCGERRRLFFGAGVDRWVVYCHGAPNNGRHVHEALAIVGLTFDGLLFESESSHSRGVDTPMRPTVFDRRPLSHGGAVESEIDQLLERHAEGRLGYVPPVELPPLPDDALEVDRLVAGFFALVDSLRKWAGMQPEVLFSSHWVAAKLDRPQKTVWRSLRRLEGAGVRAPAGSLPGRGGKRGPSMYVPGDGVASVVAPVGGKVVSLADRRSA